MKRFIIYDMTSGREVGGVLAKSELAAKQWVSRTLHFWGRFNGFLEVK